jgi:glycosyltransferase involved in cell wall biosynthesis
VGRQDGRKGIEDRCEPAIAAAPFRLCALLDGAGRLKISVITVSFNAAATIRYSIESFLAQTHPDKELIVVDGASKDETARIVESFDAPGVRLISEPDDGMYDAANKGLAAFTGDAVGFLNSDDKFADEHALVHIADGLSEADIAFGNLDFVTSHRFGSVVRRWRGSPYRKAAFKRGWMPAHPTFYVRRSVVNRLARFDTRYRIAADYDFMLRALELHDFRSVFVDRVLVHMTHGGESTSGLGAHIRHNFEALQSRRQWLGAGVVDYSLFAKPLRKLPQIAVRAFRTGWQQQVVSKPYLGDGDNRSEPSPIRHVDEQ